MLTYFVDSGTYVETYSLVRFSYFLSLLLPFLFHCPGSSIIYFIIYIYFTIYILFEIELHSLAQIDLLAHKWQTKVYFLIFLVELMSSVHAIW